MKEGRKKELAKVLAQQKIIIRSQWSKQRNKKWLRKGTAQRQQGKSSYNITRTRKHTEPKARRSHSAYI
jgi:hypothetical protein